MSASKETLQEIHQKVAAAYLKLLEAVDKGGVCEACGVVNPHFISINPAVLGHINKFLSENDISALAVPGKPLDRLQEKGKVIFLPSAEAHERFAAGE